MPAEKSEILVILDIDETLVHATTDKLDQNHDFKIETYYIYVRPHFKTFIEFIQKHFRFAIWSSASDNYVEEITKKLGLSETAEFCWGRSKATYKSMSSESSPYTSDHHYYIKRLKKVKKLGFKLEKILMIDDTPHKFQENYGNAILVSEFTGNINDSEFIGLINYLTAIKQVENVRQIEKRNWREKVSFTAI